VLKQIGNAVPVWFGEELANQLLEYYPEVRDVPPADPDVSEQQSLTDLA